MNSLHFTLHALRFFNIEHRTLNFERLLLCSLRYVSLRRDLTP